MKARVMAGKRRLSDEEIDRVVTAEADDDSAWTRAVRVRRARPASFSLPAGLAARAAFLARLHREKRVGEWLARIIRERVELEESAFGRAKQDLARRRA